MRKVSLAVLLACLSVLHLYGGSSPLPASAGAPSGREVRSPELGVFPKLSLYTLQGETQFVPSGHNELVFVGCKGEARHALSKWYRLFCEHPSALDRLGVMVIPVFPSFMANRLLRYPLMECIRQHIPERLAQHVGVLFSNMDEAAALFRLSAQEIDLLQVFLLDEQGRILWTTSGDPTSQAWRQLHGSIGSKES